MRVEGSRRPETGPSSHTPRAISATSQILLKNSEYRLDQIFSGAWLRFSDAGRGGPLTETVLKQSAATIRLNRRCCRYFGRFETTLDLRLFQQNLSQSRHLLTRSQSAVRPGAETNSWRHDRNRNTPACTGNFFCKRSSRGRMNIRRLEISSPRLVKSKEVVLWLFYLDAQFSVPV